VVLAILRLAFVLAEGLARALAADSDGGKRITWAEWQGIAADLWSQLRSLDLAESRGEAE
jgi:hypothetical protein